MNPAPRYSGDLDLVQIKEGPIRPLLKRTGEKITFFEEPRAGRQDAARGHEILWW